MTDEVVQEEQLVQAEFWSDTYGEPSIEDHQANFLPTPVVTSLDSDFYRSVKENGVKVMPKLFRHKGTGELEIIYGRNRIAAAQRAQAETGKVYMVKCMVYEGYTSVHAALETLIENVRSKPNTLSDLKAIEVLLESGRDIDAIVKATGYSKSRIKGLLKMAERLPKEIIEILGDEERPKRLTVATAKVLANSSEMVREKGFEKLLSGERLTETDIQDWRREAAEQVELPLDIFTPVTNVNLATSPDNNDYALLIASMPEDVLQIMLENCDHERFPWFREFVSLE